jgi:antibiotic biosynthesis monooxygenase (ABM) superfamily enzyme
MDLRDPKQRRRIAFHLLVWSVILMVINVGAFLVGWIDEGDLILITLILSWLALTLTAADVLATTDVRVETSDDQAAGD